MHAKLYALGYEYKVNLNAKYNKYKRNKPYVSFSTSSNKLLYFPSKGMPFKSKSCIAKLLNFSKPKSNPSSYELA